MSNCHFTNVNLCGNQSKSIVSINKGLNERGEVIEVIIKLEDDKEIFISSENNDALCITIN